MLDREVKEKLLSIDRKADLGHTHITSSSVSSSSTTDIANSFAVKQSYDKAQLAYQKAEEALQLASDGKNKIASAITGMGVEASNSCTFQQLSDKIEQIRTKAVFS